MNRLKSYAKHLLHLFKFTLCYIYCKILNIKNDEIWIISERGVDARDNGYHLYKYIRQEHPEINIMYIIKSSSADLEKISNLGKTVEYGSWKHYILFITAGRLISTHQMGFSPDGALFLFLEKRNLLKIKGNRILLQHGITKDLIEINTKLDILICGAYPEYCFFKENYKDIEKCFKYTGFARFDNLYDSSSSERRQILLMPTFRYWLIHNTEKEFLESDYYRTYSSLLNNEMLVNILDSYNCSLIFYPHFEIQKWIHLFSSKSDKIKIASFKEYDVQALLKESSVLVTDFSSVFFDFAYMHKPMFFYQFDTNLYRNSHYKEGYFDYAKDGFGEVIYDEKKLVNHLEKIAKNNFSMEEKYIERVSHFFKYNDKNNCQRIFEEISELKSMTKY